MLSDGDVGKMFTVSPSVCQGGRLDARMVGELFAHVESSVRVVEAIFRPFVFKPRLAHTQKVGANTPSIVAPIIAFVKVSRDGFIFPVGKTFIGRNILNPLDKGSVVVGELSDLDDFLTRNSGQAFEPFYLSENTELHSFQAQKFKDGWVQFLNYCSKMFAAVAASWNESSEFVQVDFGYVQKVDEKSGMAQNILNLYDDIVLTSPSVPLFEKLTNDYSSATFPCESNNSSFTKRLGHSSDMNPLSDEQRASLAHALEMGHGDILAVNGPPGTGKTTLLLSVIASIWVNAARENKFPPVIVAASTNNQAVTNIIDAFGKDFSVGTGALAGRWLPDISSYGAYFPSKAKEAEAMEKYQTEDFFDRIECDEYFHFARGFYAERVMDAFPDIDCADLACVRAGVDRLRSYIEAEVDLLEKIDGAYWLAHQLQRDLKQECGDDALEYISSQESHVKNFSVSLGEYKSVHDQAAKRLSFVSDAISDLESEVCSVGNERDGLRNLLSFSDSDLPILENKLTNLSALKFIWTKYLINESSILSMFDWIWVVRRKRKQKAQLFLLGFDSEFPVSLVSASVDNVGSLLETMSERVRNEISAFKLTVISAKEKLASLVSRLEKLRGSQLALLNEKKLHRMSVDDASKQIHECELAVELFAENVWRAQELKAAKDEAMSRLFLLLNESLGFDSESVVTFVEIDKRADTLIRFKIFRLATHYWEGRWLLDASRMISNKNARTGKNLNYAKELMRWRMMITPCIVGTFHRLPSIMKLWERDGKDKYMYDFADLLIADEAGQILPEVAGASFSLAKRALVIGDVKQSPPIWAMTAAIDIGNLIGAELINGLDGGQYDVIAVSGRTAAGGSLMLMAQGASRFHFNPELERGMYLYEHRRCHDEIIEYCNLLSYKGQLKPKRGSKPVESMALGDDSRALPALGYFNVDGFCENGGSGSKVNRFEASVIAQWVADYREALEAKYDRDIAQIVGVITPFKPQHQELVLALRQRGIKVDGSESGMTVGTVHALQGSERPIVIFSPTYSKHLSDKFIDSNSSIMNVAVSRAKDSFLVFGDIELLGQNGKNSASGLLYSLLTRDSNNELVYGVKKFRSDLADPKGRSYLLQDWREHDEFLTNILTRDGVCSITIVSPWFFYDKAVKFKSEFEKARDSGKKVTIYTDRFKNNNTDAPRHFGNIFSEKDEMSKLGVNLVITDRIHSKLLICDENIFCNGSYNWFSASRNDKWSSFETSMVNEGNVMAENILHVKDLLNRQKTSRSYAGM